YVSRLHVEHPEMGCPVAALCSEITHENPTSKEAFTRALERLIGMMAQVVPGDSKGAREWRLFATAAAVGAIGLARAITDRALADDLLSSVRRELTKGAPRRT